MRDPITDAAQDPSCLLCLTPDRGGSWWSRLRPAMPRDFSEGYRWDALQAAMYSSLPWTSDYHFTFDFTVADDFENGSYWIMYQSNGRISFALDKDARGCRFVFGSYSFNGGVFVYAPFASSLAGRHEVTLAVEGATLRVTVDGTVYEQSGERVESSAYNRVVTTSAPVTLHAVSLTDDSTGTAVWQAAYSDLYDTSNPWPSPVPRNFAEEPMTWRDEKTTAPSIGEDDCEFFIRYRLDGYPEGSAISQIFYHNSQNGSINIAFAGDGTGGNYSVIRLTNVGAFVIPLDRIRQLGEHTIRIQRVGLFVTVEFDGEVVATSSAGTEKVAVYSTTAPVSDFDGVIFETYWKSLTTGRTVWSYPSDAERVRLITKTNVRTDRGAFEAADETQPARIDTALDLRGKVSSYTVVVDFEAIAPDGKPSKMELAGQGASVTDSPSICALAQSGATGNIQLSQEINGIRKIVYKAPDNQLGRHVAVGVVDVGNSSTRLAVYYDGDLLAEDTINGLPTGTCDPRAVNWAIFDNRNGFNVMRYGKIYSALLFNRALSAAEIAALTPKKQPLSWAGIQDVVRRGRAQRYFAVGDVLTVATPRWTIEYEVTGFDQVEPADAALTHSMTLLPVRLVTNLQFDATEPGNPDANRAQYGCNRWDWSAIRQWLNSAAAPGEWWTAQHEYDAAPAYAATLAGFMADLPADFLSAVAPARLTTALSNADGGGSVETVDRFWLPSRTEIFGDATNGVAEGVLMTKYVDATDADRIKYEASGSARSWWLRSPSDDAARLSATSVSGTRGTAFTTNTYGVAAACIIA